MTEDGLESPVLTSAAFRASRAQRAVRLQLAAADEAKPAGADSDDGSASPAALPAATGGRARSGGSISGSSATEGRAGSTGASGVGGGRPGTAAAHPASGIAATLLSIPLPPMPSVPEGEDHVLAGEVPAAIKIITFPDDPTERCILADVLPEVAILEELTQAYISAGTAGAAIGSMAGASEALGAALGAPAAAVAAGSRFLTAAGAAHGDAAHAGTVATSASGTAIRSPLQLSAPGSLGAGATGASAAGLGGARSGRPSGQQASVSAATPTAASIRAGTEILSLAGLRSPSLTALRSAGSAADPAGNGGAERTSTAASTALVVASHRSSAIRTQHHATLGADATDAAGTAGHRIPKGLPGGAVLHELTDGSLPNDAASAAGYSHTAGDGEDEDIDIDLDAEAAAAAVAATATALLTDPVQFGCPVVCLLDYGVTSTAVWMVLERCAASLRSWRLDKLLSLPTSWDDDAYAQASARTGSARTGTSRSSHSDASAGHAQGNKHASGAAGARRASGGGGVASSQQARAKEREAEGDPQMLHTSHLLLVLDLFSCVLYRLHQLHASGVSHYDVKCDNVMLREGFEPVLVTHLQALQQDLAQLRHGGAGRRRSRHSVSSQACATSASSATASGIGSGAGVQAAVARPAAGGPAGTEWTARSAFGLAPSSEEVATGPHATAGGIARERRHSGGSEAHGLNTARSHESAAATAASRWLQLLPYVCWTDFGESVFHPGTPAAAVPLVTGRGTECIKAPELLRAARTAAAGNNGRRASEGAGGASVGAASSTSLVRHGDAAGAQAAATAAKLKAGTGASCDVWSLGCLLFELVTGHFLFDAEDWARFYLTVTGDETLMSPAAAAFLLSLPASPSSAGMLTATSGAASVAHHAIVAAAAAATARSAGNSAAAGSSAVVTASTAVTVAEVTAISSSTDATTVSSVSEEVADDALHAASSGGGALPPSSVPGLKLVQAWGTHADSATIAPTSAGGATARTGSTRSGASAPTSRVGRAGAGGGLAALHVPQPSDAPPAPAPPAPSLADLLPIISPVRMAALQEALPPHLARRFAELMRSLLVRGVGDRPDLGAMQRMVWEFRAEVRATAAGAAAGAGVGAARVSATGQHP